MTINRPGVRKGVNTVLGVLYLTQEKEPRFISEPFPLRLCATWGRDKWTQKLLSGFKCLLRGQLCESWFRREGSPATQVRSAWRVCLQVGADLSSRRIATASVPVREILWPSATWASEGTGCERSCRHGNPTGRATCSGAPGALKEPRRQSRVWVTETQPCQCHGFGQSRR